MAEFTPTQEQLDLRAAFRTARETDGSLLVAALAGSGKTTTLFDLARSEPQTSMLYVAYNKGIQLDAEAKAPRNLTCKTAHALAWRNVIGNPRTPLGRRLNSRDFVGGRDVARILNIRNGFECGTESVTAAQVGSIVVDTVDQFCKSASDVISKHHVPFQEGLEDCWGAFTALVLPLAVRAWVDITSESGALKFSHQHYLKIWQLSHPRLNYTVIMLDEAQDANPVIKDIVERQQATLVLVGDQNQAINGWNGAIDAMATFKATQTGTLTKSFRFGQGVADEGNKWLTLLASPLKMEGFEKINSTVEAVESPDAILCRTNAGCIRNVMALLAEGKRVALVGGANDLLSLVRGSIKLMAGQRSEHHTLRAFANWDAVREYVNDTREHAPTELKLFVKLVDEYGPEVLIDTLGRIVKEEVAEVTVSTAHKAKGREWDSVRIASDFPQPKEGEPISKEAAMLNYVAVTRARLTLDNLGLAWVDDYMEAN